MTALLTIITINYNNRQGLLDTVLSIAPQIEDDVHWIVVDGGSNDGSIDVIHAYSKKFSWYCSEPDDGIYHAMNKGIKSSDSDYILFINSGDYLHPRAVRSIKKYLETENPDIVLGSGDVIFAGVLKWTRKARKLVEAKYGLPALHQSTLYKKKKLPNEGYDLAYKICGDHWLAATMYKDRCSYGLLDEKIGIHPIHGGVASSNILKTYGESWRIQREVLNLPFLYRLLSYLQRLSSYVKMKILSNKNIVNAKLVRRLLKNKVQYIDGL